MKAHNRSDRTPFDMTHGTPLNPAAQEMLAFWFSDTGHQNSPQAHGAFWTERMQGGMDEGIFVRFADLTLAGATGQLDHWADSAWGRLALLIVRDQFPRSLWRATPAACAQDIKATRLAPEGRSNGHFGALAPWEQTFFVIAISHCEGPDQLIRLDHWDAVVQQIIAQMTPETIGPMGEGFRAQHARIKGVIARFGFHTLRNPVYGRASTAEETYIATRDFAHNARPNGAPNAT